MFAIKTKGSTLAKRMSSLSSSKFKAKPMSLNKLNWSTSLMGTAWKNSPLNTLDTVIDLATFISHKKKLFSAFRKGFAVVLDAKAKTYGAKSFSKGKSRRADDLVDADKLKDFKESLRPIELSFDDFDSSMEITLESAKSTRELRFTGQIDESKASSSQPESSDRAFDEAMEALGDLLEDEDDPTSGSGPYSSLADPPSAKFTLINDATNKRKNDTRSFTLEDAAAGTSSSNAGPAKRRRPSQLEENEGVEDVSTEGDHEEAAEA
ncbi:hypothetical protein MBM_05113 [Drepanopeziza brunnea f. sp. 'multigermtubi' MB_m1]|uniref:Uncharacterized protein n=1 Tax=Marssonina brunnea f. sp. multigermtubi (strain MB_m1) TaxID=1072389 RepID=K1XVF6_MARBU|nr:uncharacterized protein MBM_05113 [Drepanopeziza brunnea f. sp. 'multigermtubi' MB_m1]EKD16644.1 hypothetical protein MBM_05113 [Drepanopeziza brunnea f. sp. 'multigermtubi' MB_m1]